MTHGIHKTQETKSINGPKRSTKHKDPLDEAALLRSEKH